LNGRRDPPENSGRPVETSLRVRYSETDQMGIVYHAHYLVWFEIGRTEWCRAAGLPYAGMEAAGLFIPVTRVECSFRGRPRYDDAHLTWLFAELECANVGGRLVRRLVIADDGRPAGSYVAYVEPHGIAEVVQLAAAEPDVPLVLDHLVNDAARGGAVELRGRFEHHLLPALRRRRCRLVPIDWAMLYGRDAELLAAVHGGRALLSRLDGEWWMRPDPFAAGAPAAA